MIGLKREYNSYQNRMLFLERFNKTQITISNSTTQEQWARLFGAYQGISTSTQDNYFTTDSYPQAILFNPLNELIYVVNQLAASLQVFDKNEKLIKRILLDESPIPTASPLAIELNPLSGEVYLLGALADELYVINSDLELENTVKLPIRPYSLRFNAINQKLYIQHLVGTIVNVLDVNNEFSIDLIETNETQAGLAINTTDGSWTVVSSNGKTLKTYNSSNLLIRTFDFNDHEFVQPIYSKNGEQILLLDKAINGLISLNPNNGTVGKSVLFESTPTKLVVGKENDYFISLIEPNKIVVLNELLETTASFNTHIAPFVWSVNQTEEVFYISDTINSRILLVNQLDQPQTVSYSDNYKEVVIDFQYQPVLVEHLKVIYSELNSLPLIRIGSKSPAGKKESRLISLDKYHSPQHYSPVYQVTQVKGEIIDGRAFWEVLIPPEQVISLLIYHG